MQTVFHLFNSYLLRAYYVFSIVLDVEDTAVNKTKICFSIGFKLLFRGRIKDKNNNHNDQMNYMLDNKCNNKCRAQGDVGLGLEVSECLG